MSIASPQRLDRIAFIILQLTLFFAPFFFVPSLSVPFLAGKGSFMIYAVAVIFALWCVARLKDGAFEAPRSLFYWSAGIWAVVYALSGAFSGNTAASFAGTGFDLGTLSFFVPSLLLFMLVPLLVRSKKDIVRSFISLSASFLVVALFHAIRLVFGPDALSFGMLSSATASVVGRWNDLGIFAGLFALLSLICLERLSLSGMRKALVNAGFFLSLVLLIAVNFSTVWIVLASFSLVLFVYKFSFEKGADPLASRVSYRPLLVIALALVFLFVGKAGGLVSDIFGTSQIEVRPSWGATLEIGKAALKDGPLFGAGPNRFSSEWLLHKPEGINQTLFWNVSFNNGIGLLPSLLASTGILGFAAATFFLVLFIILSVKALFRRGGSVSSQFTTLSSLFASIYLWIFSIFYVPSPVIWILTLAMTGLFFAALREDGIVAWKEYPTAHKPAASFVSVLLLIVALIGTLAFSYFVTVKLVAALYYQKGVIAVSAKSDLAAGEKYISKAASVSPSDVYYQSLAQIYQAKLNILFQDTKISQAEAQKQFQDLLSSALQAAQKAVSLDPSNYANYMTLGGIYESVVPLNIEGAYESAKKSYEAALTYNPQSPEIYLVLARLEVAKKDNKAAKTLIDKALEKKGDYADAIFLLAQIQISEDDVPNAIKSVSAIATLNPQDPGVFFQLGLLYYNSKDYMKAGAAFERAVTLSPEYANARYFLGLSYYQVKQPALALEQFKAIQKTNPDNAEVASIIKNLSAGKAPFATAANPEKRSTLPVKQ